MIFYQSESQDFTLLQGDSLHILPTIDDKSINMIFADPPYFLSNDGLTVKNGMVQSVNKGDWDKFSDDNEIYIFTYDWLSQAKRMLADNGTIWMSGTHHNIFTLGRVLSQLNFKVLNMITWEKPNPPPNFSCRYFTYSTEWIIWARKNPKIPHYFDYELMKSLNGDKQMKDVWRLPAVSSWEKQFGKHPTQKPLGLLSRIVLASTKANDLVLDPFTGSSTTGIAANLFGRKFIGVDQDSNFLTLSKNRYLGLDENSRQYFKERVKQQISL